MEHAMTASPNRLLAVVFGVVYLAVGFLGFGATKGVELFGTDGGLLFGLFEVNLFHNAVHILIGAALVIAGASNAHSAKIVNTGIGAAYLLLGVVGLFILDSPVNILAINSADNVLHLGSAVLLLAVGLGADKRTRARTVAA
jgi:hypothetical protein